MKEECAEYWEFSLFSVCLLFWNTLWYFRIFVLCGNFARPGDSVFGTFFIAEVIYLQKNDQTFMRRALELAKRGAGRVSPNPMVGCVIVKDGRIIGEGWHEKCGG